MRWMSVVLTLLFAMSFTPEADAQKQVLRTLPEFEKLNISGSVDIRFLVSDLHSIIIEGSEKQIEEIVAEVRNGELEVRYNTGGWKWMTNNRNVRITITAPTLISINASGASNFTADNVIIAPEMAIAASGAADVALVVDVYNISLKASGGADIRISGKASEFTASASGGADIMAKELHTKIATVKASGGSDVIITVHEKLTASASGGADIKYAGRAKDVTVSKSGGADVIGI
jgi:hypothetical protein